MTTIVIMPGGFHPFHAGHLALYDSAREAFPGAEVFVAATNDTSARPFPFAVKEKLAKLAGVAPGHFVQVKSPFRAEEITSKFDPARDRLIFVRSEKDADKPPQAGGIKRDGSAAYLQPLAGQTNIRPFKEHAYMAYLPTVEFGPGMTSATEIRTAWPTLNEKRKTALVMSLYPRTQSNPKLANTVVKLLDAAIGTQDVAEEVNPDITSGEKYFSGPTPNVRMGDFIFNASLDSGGYRDPNAKGLKITAYDPKNFRKIGWVDFIVHKDKKGNTWLESDETEVDDRYQRKGVATMMYAYAKSLGNDIKPSDLQSNSGIKMWKKWGSDAARLVGEQGVAEEVNPEILSTKNSLPTENITMGDYEFNARIYTGELGNPGLQIRAYDPKKPQNQLIGHADFIVLTDKKGNTWLESDDTSVNPSHQGKGVAAMMYAFAKSLGNDIKPSDIQEPPGEKMWKKWGKDAKNLVGQQGVAEGFSNAVTFFRGEPILSQERLNQLKSSIGKPYPILRKEGSAANIGTYMSPDGDKATSFVKQALAGQGKGGVVTQIQVDPNSFSKGDGGIDEAVIITNIAGLVSNQTPNKNDPLRIQDRKQAMLKYLGPGVKKYLNDPLLSDPKIVQSWYNPEFAQKNWNTINSGKQAVTKPGESNVQERMIRILGPLAENIRRDPEVINYFISHNPGDWVEYNFRMNSDGSGTKVVDVKYYPPAKQGVAENFADGRNPQDKGDSKRHGINTKASVSSLRKTAKQGGRKGQLAHWLANMKAGRAKNEDADSDYIEEKWSSEYKSSINCADPKGFSQKAHCAGRKK